VLCVCEEEGGPYHESREKIGEPETSQDDISAGPLFVAGMFLRKKIYRSTNIKAANFARPASLS
jgi:hypothetical protein